MDEWCKDRNLIKALISSVTLADLVELLDDNNCGDHCDDRTKAVESLVIINHYIREITG